MILLRNQTDWCVSRSFAGWVNGWVAGIIVVIVITDHSPHLASGKPTKKKTLNMAHLVR